MEDNDIIRQTMISEVDGVVVSNTFYYLIRDSTLTGTINDLAKSIHADWWSRLVLKMSDQVFTTCTIWENLMGNDPTFAEFVTIAGASVGDNLPADTCVLVTRKAVRSDGAVATGTICLSGASETLQEGGHLTDYETAFGLLSWLTEDQVYGTTVLRNVQKSVLTGIAQYNEVVYANSNPHLVKKPSRRSLLCKSV